MPEERRGVGHPPLKAPAISIERPTPVADFPRPLAEAVVATLRDHGVDAEAVDRGDVVEVLVAEVRRDEAVATMAARMDEIRARVDEGEQPPPPPSASPDPDDPRDPSAPPLVSERLRSLWLVPVILVPLLVLLGSALARMDVAVLVLLAGMVALVAVRQRRRQR